MMYEPISKARTSETPGLEDYLKAIRARWWLVALFVIAGLVAATMYTNSRTPMYEATARVLVRPSPVGSTNNQEAPVVLQREKEVVQSNAVAKQVQDELGIGGSTASLLSDLSVDFEPESDTLRLKYRHESPRQAADIVNAFAQSYVTQREEAAVAFYNDQVEVFNADREEHVAARDAAQAAINDLTEQRRAVSARPNTDPTRQGDLNALDTQIESLSAQVRQANDRINRIDDSMSEIERRLASRTASAELLGEALPPSEPSGVSDRMILAAGGVLGLVLGIASAFLLDRLDKTARESDDVELALGAQVLSSVPPLGVGNRSGGASLVMLSEKRSASAQRARESYRRLRSSVQFLSSSDGTSSFVVTSAAPGEGKSTTASNLALALAQSGASTVLVSADMRRPTVTQMFGLSNAAGLSQWLAGDDNVDLTVQLLTVPNLSIVPSGPTPKNPGELLASSRFESLIRHLEQTYDFVIIDTPPVASTADASAIAARAGGVIAVVDSRRTDTNSLLQVRADITRTGGRLVGAVLNRDRSQRGGLLRGRYGYYERARAEA